MNHSSDYDSDSKPFAEQTQHMDSDDEYMPKKSDPWKGWMEYQIYHSCHSPWRSKRLSSPQKQSKRSGDFLNHLKC